MALSKRDEDQISYCGSISGETFSSRRRRNTCTLRQHNIDSLTQKLRELESDFVKQDESETKKRFNTSFHHYRFVVVMLGGFSLGTMIILRYSITVAILKMVNQTALYMEEHPNKTIDDFLDEGYALGGEFDWDNEIQHMIMSWYMVAYTLPQVPCTKLGIKLGSRLAVPISLMICAIANLLTPVVAYWGWEWVIALRLVNGVGAAAVLPMMLNLIENWMPYDQISLGLTFAQLLQSILTAANPLIAGYLSAIHWSYAFYVPGTATIVFCAIWLTLITDRPDESWLISRKELDLICVCSSGDVKQEEKSKMQGSGGCAKILQLTEQAYQPTWKDVFRIPSFYAFVFMWCFYCSSYSSFVFILPTYLRQFLKIHVSVNGIYCALIQSGCLISILWPHPVLQLLQKRFKLSPTASRRITHAIICLMTAMTWFYVGLFHDTQLLVLFLNRCFQGSNDIVVTGTLMGNYAKAGLSSLVFSMVNTVGNLSVVFSSTLIGYILDYTGQAVEGWTCIYLALGAAQLLMLLAFVTVIRSEPIVINSRR